MTFAAVSFDEPTAEEGRDIGVDPSSAANNLWCPLLAAANAAVSPAGHWWLMSMPGMLNRASAALKEPMEHAVTSAENLKQFTVKNTASQSVVRHVYLSS